MLAYIPFVVNIASMKKVATRCIASCHEAVASRAAVPRAALPLLCPHFKMSCNVKLKIGPQIFNNYSPLPGTVLVACVILRAFSVLD